MYCKNCGVQMDESFKVCTQCGTLKGSGSAFCAKCGSPRGIGTAFCTKCGTKYNAEQPVTVGAINENKKPQLQKQPKQQFQPQQPTQQQFQPQQPTQQQFQPQQPTQQQFQPQQPTQQQFQPQQPTQQQFQPQQPTQQQFQPQPTVPTKKFCRNCGSEVLPNQVVCTKCGVKIGEGTSFCPHCGSAVQPGAEACMSCGRSIKRPFDFAKYFKEFGNNFVSLFKQTDKMAMIFDNFINFASVLVFILALFPVGFVSMGAFGISQGASFNAFTLSAFAGILIILALLSAVMKYEPFCIKFMQGKPQIAKFYVFLTPALELISTIIIMIQSFAGLTGYAKSALSVSYYGSLISASSGLTFGGWLLVLVVAASVADAVYLFMKNNKKTTV
ncbi:MAG: zinc ribbon domain-containing protein [Clostridia bacterium]|nr:zinc ribbon domain-containing protein [Clostridia bacterium]